MANIVGAEFEDLASAEAALAALSSQGFAYMDVTTFYLNAAGQQATIPTGSDRFEDPDVVGIVVAVHVQGSEERERAASILWRHRARSIELAEGSWRNGTWQDFDPASIPRARASVR